MQDVRAVVLAGPGGSLYPLVDGPSADAGEDTLVKALLPVGNRPMIEGVLRWIEEAGINDVLVLALDWQQQQLSHYFRTRRSDSTLNSSLRIELQCMEDSGRAGTATIVAWAAAQGHIKSDFIVLPCDLLLSPSSSQPSVYSLASLLDAHRIDGALITTLLYERAAANEDKEADNVEDLLVSLEEATATLLDLRNLDDYEEEIEIRSSLFARHPDVFQTIALLHTHVYVCSTRVLAFLKAYPELRSFREDVVPWLCKAQWQSQLLVDRLHTSTDLIPRHHPLAPALARSSTVVAASGSTEPPRDRPPPPDSVSTLPSARTRPPLRSLATSGGSTYAYSSPRMTDDVLSASKYQTKCSVRIWRKDDGFCSRGNTTAAYAELNRLVLRNNPPGRPSQPGVGSDSIAGAHLTVGERASIKRSSIGRHCSIGKNVKLAGCILMDAVSIADGAKLDNCIVASGVRVGENAQLKSVVVGPNEVIEADAQRKDESIPA